MLGESMRRVFHRARVQGKTNAAARRRWQPAYPPGRPIRDFESGRNFQSDTAGLRFRMPRMRRSKSWGLAKGLPPSGPPPRGAKFIRIEGQRHERVLTDEQELAVTAARSGRNIYRSGSIR